MYELKSGKLKKLCECHGSNKAVVLVMCGSFNPIHNAHISLFNAAKNALETPHNGLEVVGGFISPVADGYKKAGLASFEIRRKLVEEAVALHPFLEIDEWEGLQSSYTRTYYVLNHLRDEIQSFYLRQEPEEMAKRMQDVDCAIELVLLCGTDLLASFFIPKAWPLNLLQKLVNEYRIVVVNREMPTGCNDIDIWKTKLRNCDMEETIDGTVYSLTFENASVLFCSLEVPDNTSSTLVRELVHRISTGDDTARSELARHIPPGSVQDVVEYYKK